MSKPVVLVVEANAHLRSLITWNLGQQGCDCEHTDTLLAARQWLQQQSRLGLVILDADLGEGSGLEFCRWLRGQRSVPVLLLSARNREPDIVQGLDAGADDYLVKPFGLQEFQARVRALLRRQNARSGEHLLQLRDLTVDPVQRRVSRGGQTVDLTPQEFSLLYVLLQAGGETLTRVELLERAWPDRVDNPRTVDTHVLSLRKKLETDPQAPQLIVTVRAVGYRLSGEATDAWGQEAAGNPRARS